LLAYIPPPILLQRPPLRAFPLSPLSSPPPPLLAVLLLLFPPMAIAFSAHSSVFFLKVLGSLSLCETLSLRSCCCFSGVCGWAAAGERADLCSLGTSPGSLLLTFGEAEPGVVCEDAASVGEAFASAGCFTSVDEEEPSAADPEPLAPGALLRALGSFGIWWAAWEFPTS